MSILTIYRVEDDLGQGPYRIQARHTDFQRHLARSMSTRHSGPIRWWDDPTVESDPDLHPGPSEDPGMWKRWRYIDFSMNRAARHYNFGFESETRLSEWFFGERRVLDQLNMHVAAYEVPHQAVLRGQWQLAFRRPSASLVYTRPLAGLVE